MDNIIDALNNAYQGFVAAAAGVLEAKESSGGQKTAVAVAAAALENFKQCQELFRVARDQAEEFVESVKQKDRMSKAVQWLVIELQQGSGTAGGSSHPHPSVPFDARFSEDAAQ
ncbi:Mediator of RNA polymerase II transcription subunit 32 [Camellia lanceoleosa]|uniref:Mediator of RNA polymerase II transcription subunit 32 n=1 Tax=Camellia lanceoleosa TaxID=1840588 RepID=A0ACC0IVF4_9ERIC|nr:Mediator of RNA polymerase II transcription subunit 32 [Camellia lanceoleosa]